MEDFFKSLFFDIYTEKLITEILILVFFLIIFNDEKNTGNHPSQT